MEPTGEVGAIFFPPPKKSNNFCFFFSEPFRASLTHCCCAPCRLRRVVEVVTFSSLMGSDSTMRESSEINMKALQFTVLAWFLAASSAQAVTIDLVTIGNAGNAPDPRPSAFDILRGSVAYVYQIGKYEVTAGQYAEFLNAVADADPNGLYHATMGDPDPDGPRGANIQRTGSSPNYSYSVAADWANRPVNYVSFWDAARFANWLHNGQPTGAQGPGTTEDGAYLNVGNQATFARQPGAKFFIPTKDEWYKAAYHDRTAGLAATYFKYATGSNALPGRDITESIDPGNNANYNIGGTHTIGKPYYRTEVGEFELSDSPYGTFDQGGNVREWNETASERWNGTAFESWYRGIRGGAFNNNSSYLHASPSDDDVPTTENLSLGFRVASIPLVSGDYNNDGAVDAADLTLWKAGFGAAGSATPMQGDADGDLDVDGADFLIWQRSYATPIPPTAVPEPSSIVVLLIALSMLRSHASKLG